LHVSSSPQTGLVFASCERKTKTDILPWRASVGIIFVKTGATCLIDSRRKTGIDRAACIVCPTRMGDYNTSIYVETLLFLYFGQLG
jgi:hypothetical protein